jgi:DNA-binding MarR family transcriptional regulator
MNEFNQEVLNLPVNLYRAAIALRGEITRRLTQAFGEEFTADYWFILNHLFTENPLTQGRLAELTNRDRASLSRTIACMERIDLVSKTVEPFDKRKELISPTQTAIKFKPEAERIVLDAVGQVMQNLKPIEVMELNRMLGALFENINKA